METSVSQDPSVGLAAKGKRAPLLSAAAVFALAMAIVGLMFWSTDSVDDLSRQRQHTLVAQILSENAARIGHDQEGTTVWDTSIRELRKERLNLRWVDLNLGIWMHTYYGHDAAYVLNPDDKPLYSMVAGVRGSPRDFAAAAAEVLPLVASLRKSQATAPGELPAHQLSPGVTDILVVAGHPSIVSVKPIVSDSGDIEQVPGTEFVHISVRWLDGSFVEAIRGSYGLDDARFVRGSHFRPGEKVEPLHSQRILRLAAVRARSRSL
jgi:sensor domain CHASE-containing protein